MPTFDTPEPIAVNVEIMVGDVQVLASDRADTVVDVRPSDPAKKSDVTAAAQTRVECTGGRLLVRAPKGWRRYSFRGGDASIDVQISLPEGSQLRIEAAVASLRCTGRLGECRCQTAIGDIHVDHAESVEIKTGMGDIQVGRALDHAEVTTGSGDVHVDCVDGTAVIKNSNGDTSIGQVSGDLRVNAANGKISVDEAHATVAAKTANGDVRLGEVARGAVVASTGFGKLDVGVRDGVAAWLDLSTGFGTVHNSLGTSQPPAAGEDVVEIRARSGFGDISIRRSVASAAGETVG